MWAAADALIAAGERPTIERVRLKIGRGSPNTVSPILEAWFATLGPRLGVALAGTQVEEGAPKELRLALDSVWTAALAAARDKADKALGPERNTLAQQTQVLETAREKLSQREAAVAERGAALEHALELAKSQLRDQGIQLEKADRDLEQARGSLANLVQERDADRHKFDGQLVVLTQERERLEQRASANERRLLEEVDRARQEVKQSSRAIEDANLKHATEKQALERASVLLESRMHEGQIELATLKERLQAVEERARRLETALAAAREPKRAARAQPAKSPTSGRRITGAAKRAP